jgi:hypothetical protein
MGKPQLPERLRISRNNPTQIRQFITECHKLISQTYPDVEWSFVAQMASNISQGSPASNIIGIQISEIVRKNLLIIDPFNVEDL